MTGDKVAVVAGLEHRFSNVVRGAPYELLPLDRPGRVELQDPEVGHRRSTFGPHARTEDDDPPVGGRGRGCGQVVAVGPEGHLPCDLAVGAAPAEEQIVDEPPGYERPTVRHREKRVEVRAGKGVGLPPNDAPRGRQFEQDHGFVNAPRGDDAAVGGRPGLSGVEPILPGAEVQSPDDSALGR